MFGPRILSERANLAKRRVQLIHRSVRFDASVVLRHTWSTKQTCGPGVARASVDFHNSLRDGCVAVMG